MRTLLLVLIAFLLPFSARADKSLHSATGTHLEKNADTELKLRVLLLERTVAQLQKQMLQLALKNETASSSIWVCHIQAFSKTHIASGTSKASALAQVLKKCSDEAHAIHCDESKVSCGNE